MTLFLILLGGAFVWLGSRYEIGHLARMGPGYLPVALGAMIIILGSLIIALGQNDSGYAVNLRWRAAASTFAALFAFAFLITRAGLPISVFAAVFLASFSERPFRPLAALVTAVSIAGLTYVIFVLLLRMYFPPVGGH